MKKDAAAKKRAATEAAREAAREAKEQARLEDELEAAMARVPPSDLADETLGEYFR